MKIKIPVYLIILYLFLFISSNIFAEYVFLKSGKIIGGSIISETTDSVVIRDKKRKVFRVKRGNIMRILYTDIYMGKVYVQKNDGKGIICYMVDEDRETYTFRMNLFKPKEFVIRRDSVLFIARGNPSGLQIEGDPDFNNINVKWFPPYNQVKGYQVYVKEVNKRNAEWEKNTRTSSKSTKIKKLKSNTLYYAVVRAIDDQGEESPPSNEIKFKTKNRAPEKIEEASFENISKDKKSPRIRIKWKEAVDTDGKVEKYKVYKIKGGKKIFEAEIRARKSPTFTFKKGDDFEEVIVTAVDDLGAESKDKYIILRYRKEFDLSFYTGVAIPERGLQEILNFGFVAGIKGVFHNYYADHSFLGFNWQVAYFLPDYDFNYDEDEIFTFLISPLTLNLGYTLRPTEKLTVTPHINAGIAGVYLNYSYYSMVDGEKATANEFEILPTLGFSLEGCYYVNEKFFLSSYFDFYDIFEDDKIMRFFTFSIGAGLRF